MKNKFRMTMKANILILTSLTILVSTINVQAQSSTDSTQGTVTKKTEKKYQAKAPETQPFGAAAFDASNKTTVRWLGLAGFLINSRGTNIMVDPLLKGFDMPILIDFPIDTKDVPKLDAVLVTHSDNDHYSIPTCRDLSSVTRAYHSTQYVDSLMKNEGFPSFGHDIGEVFNVGPVRVKLTPADHAWQNAYPGASKRHFKNEDCAGFWIETPDGTIWATGDTRLMPEHLTMPTPDAIFFDFSDSEWHFGFEGAVKLANAYPNTALLLCHWGSVDSPDFTPFNGDPKQLEKRVINPKRIYLLAPGEPFTLKKYQELFGAQSVPHATDPELMSILQRLIFGEIFYIGNLDDKTRELITITVLTTNQTLPQLSAHTNAALNIGVPPIQIREAVYQSAPFIGFPKVLNALATINKVFTSRGIALPLENKGTIEENQRFEKGKEMQFPLYGDRMKEYMKDLPGEFAEAIPRLLTESCFGDFYTRGGLDTQTRELLIFCALATLGGTERQMASHAVGNLKVGNSKETLLSAMVHCYPYIGFPRVSNAISVIKEAKVE